MRTGVGTIYALFIQPFINQLCVYHLGVAGWVVFNKFQELFILF
jgi:hypothetical protein